MPLSVIGYAFIGGIVPCLLWLYFLLREDATCPEPRSLILLAFLGGMVAVPLALPLEHFACVAWGTCSNACPESQSLTIIFAWATIEETLKYGLAALLVLWRRQVDESIDLVIYMITVALGFAALENTLFLIQPFSQGHLLTGLLTDNMRFVGSTLLHVVSSAAIGLALAFSYKKSRIRRAAFASAGLILAIALHALFNFLILAKCGSYTLFAFFVVWLGVVALFGIFELLRYYRYRHLSKNTC